MAADLQAIVAEFAPDLRLKMIDVGAAQFEESHSRFALLARKFHGDLFLFEPNPEQYNSLQKRFADLKNLHVLPFAIGGGGPGELRICRHPGGSSLLEPNFAVACQYHSYGEWLEVVDRIPLETVTLDSLEIIRGSDFLKLDIQGAELDTLMHATNALEEILVVECEVNFVQQYVDQPLFSEIELFMRRRNFMFHKFLGYGSRLLASAAISGDPLQPGNQWLWSDAVFVRDPATWPTLATHQLIKIAIYMHELYASDDFARHALAIADDRSNGSRALSEPFARLLETGENRED